MLSPRRLLPSALGGLGIAALRSPRWPRRTGSWARQTCRSRCGCSAGPPRSCWSCPSWPCPPCGRPPSFRASTGTGCSSCRRSLARLASLVGLGLFVLVVYAASPEPRCRTRTSPSRSSMSSSGSGLPVASVLFGDIFKALSPWRSSARAGPLGGSADRAQSVCAGAAALPELAWHVARGRGPDRLRLDGARVRAGRPRPALHAGRAVAGLFRGHARRHGPVRRGGVVRARRRLRRLLRSALAHLGAVPGRARGRLPARAAERPARHGDPRRLDRLGVHDHRHHHLRRLPTAACGAPTSRTCRACSRTSAST